MNIYTVRDDRTAKDILQLIKLNAECARVHWSRTINNVPANVMNALETIEDYVENKVAELCDAKVCELTQAEEDEIIQFIKRNQDLKPSLGAGVIMRNQAAELMRLMEKEDGLDKIMAAIDGVENVVFF